MLDFALARTAALLGFLPDEVRGALVLPVTVILLLLVILGLLRMAPKIDNLLGPLGSGLCVVLGLLALLPEYVATTLLRRSGRQPPAPFFLYDAMVAGLVGLGSRAAHAGIAPLVRQKWPRRWAAVAGVVAIVGLGNAAACPDPPGACKTPIGAWQDQVKATFDSPDPTPSPARTKVKG
jgi:hypothetical protein